MGTRTQFSESTLTTENHFEQVLKHAKEIKKDLSLSDLNELVIQYKKTHDQSIYFQILGILLVKTNILNIVDQCKSVSWSALADDEDFQQELQFAVLLAIDHFDPNKGNFNCFGWKTCEGRLNDFVHRTYQGSRSIGNIKQSNKNSDVIESCKSYCNDIADYFVGVEDNSNIMVTDIWACVDTLPEPQRKAIRALYKERTTREKAAKKLGITVSQLRYACDKGFATIINQFPDLKDYLNEFDHCRDLQITMSVELDD